MGWCANCWPSQPKFYLTIHFWSTIHFQLQLTCTWCGPKWLWSDVKLIWFLSKFEISKLNHGHCDAQEHWCWIWKRKWRRRFHLSVWKSIDHTIAQAGPTFLIISYTLNLLMSCQMLKKCRKRRQNANRIPRWWWLFNVHFEPCRKMANRIFLSVGSNDALWNAPKY